MRTACRGVAVAATETGSALARAVADSGRGGGLRAAVRSLRDALRGASSHASGSAAGGGAGGAASGPDARRGAAWRRLGLAGLGGLGGLGGLVGLLAPPAAQAIELPENRAEGTYHLYRGGGVTAQGPALLVRKSLADRVSLSGTWYVDSVSNASIDVVTTASPYRENRQVYELGADYVVRDALLSVSTSSSREPDYVANAVSVDLAQEVYGGMTTVALGFTRAVDDVGRKDIGFFDQARHWQYRLGVTQILSTRWLASLNFEAVADSGYLGSPYRAARVFGAAVPERNPRTRTSRAVRVSTAYDLGSRDALKAEYRYFWDTWAIRAHTVQAGYTRWFGDRWLADTHLRFYSQDRALFYSDNASTDTLYLSRNRQLSTFTNLSLAAKLSWRYGRVADAFDVSLNGAYELMSLSYKDFTDVRTGQAYRYRAHVLQAYVSATF